MFNLPSPYNEITTAVALATGAIATGTYVWLNVFKSNKQFSDETIITLQSNVKALQDRVDIVETESKEKDNKISKLEGKVEQLEKENTSLRETLSLRNPQFEKTMKNLADILPKLVTRVEEINNGANERYSNIEECSSKILGLLEAK
jgi:predicted  nucleic acid-binding Zn-ribbon protein